MDRPMLEVRKVTQFDPHAPGWAEWHDVRRGRRDEFSFFKNAEEVARARIYPDYHLQVPYEGLRQGPFVAIDRIVVREGKRDDKIGTEAVALLIGRYPGQEMIAFSAADRFWTKAGWIRAVRLDGDDRAWPLFVHTGCGGRR